MIRKSRRQSQHHAAHRSTGAPDFIANFDSASAMLRAVAASLRGADFPVVGMMPRPLIPAAKAYGAAVNLLPERLREQVYIWSGWGEAVSSDKAGEIDIERIAEWAADEYTDDRKYPAVMVGSSNGALTHVCSALGMAWLPQTFLVPIRRGYLQPDEAEEDIRRCEGPARELLARNPDVVLHHMHDPNQDRLMVQRMTYFRVKKRTLGPAYESFLERRLQPGGTIYLVECNLSWPTTSVQERHYFQFGAHGGATIDEFHHGGERVKEYLRRYDSPREQWDPPEPDTERPEAEWGFEPALREDVERFAREHGYRVKRICFDSPEDTSPLVADFYRDWNVERGITRQRLLVESFILLDPYLALLTGSVPFWMVFNKEPSARNLERFLDEREPFDEINMLLFSHGVESVGLPGIDRWRGLLARARNEGRFLGVDPDAYPRDFAVLGRYRDAILKAIPARHRVPPPLDPARFESFVQGAGERYAVALREAGGAT